jgi:hypothetical protein
MLYIQTLEEHFGESYLHQIHLGNKRASKLRLSSKEKRHLRYVIQQLTLFRICIDKAFEEEFAGDLHFGVNPDMLDPELAEAMGLLRQSPRDAKSRSSLSIHSHGDAVPLPAII